MKLPPDVEEKAVRDASNISDDVARLAQWFCSQGEGFIPGEDLFDGNHRLQKLPLLRVKQNHRSRKDR
jgi:hypothetical protein